jgi:hypothetical protein
MQIGVHLQPRIYTGDVLDGLGKRFEPSLRNPLMRRRAPDVRVLVHSGGADDNQSVLGNDEFMHEFSIPSNNRTTQRNGGCFPRAVSVQYQLFISERNDGDAYVRCSCVTGAYLKFQQGQFREPVVRGRTYMRNVSLQTASR